MKTLLNIIWLVFGGLWLALGYFLAGVVCCVLIVTIPWGLASFRIASYALWPFGRMVVDKPGGNGIFALLGNVIWLLVAGIWIAIGHVVTAFAMAITIVGIPLADRQPQAHPGLADAARENRSSRAPPVCDRLQPRPTARCGSAARGRGGTSTVSPSNRERGP